MTQDDAQSIQRIAAIFDDTIADNSKLREGLTDDEAIPLVEWGSTYARTLAQRIASSGTLLPDEQISDQAYNLTRLMTRLNWVVTYRHKKDAAWLTKTFQMVNKLSETIGGENAPIMTDEDIVAWLASHADQSNGALLQDLMTRFAPSTGAAPAPDTMPDTAPAPVSEAPVTPLSAPEEVTAIEPEPPSAVSAVEPDTLNATSPEPPPSSPAEKSGPWWRRVLGSDRSTDADA